MDDQKDVLAFPAIELRQGDRVLYSFAAEGKQLPLFTTVSRVRRNEQLTIEGYQRPEVLSHIAAIRRYLESDRAIVPNALVVAFDSRVRFEPLPSANGHPYARPGTILIPIDASWGDHEKPGWIVDGQQRGAAIREARVGSFPVFITAFVTDDDAEQRSQFILVNSTKPLPRSLIYELLPTTDAKLPAHLESKRFPALLLERLNFDSDSPLQGMVRTPTVPEGIIKDNSLLRVLETSLSDGALYYFRDPETGRGDIESMLLLLKNYWEAVGTVFPEAWSLPPRRSRLVHGVGIASLGFVMDAITDRYLDRGIPETLDYETDLRLIEAHCHWTGGLWDFGGGVTRKWNELQNIQRDIQMLTSYLLQSYRKAVQRTDPSGDLFTRLDNPPSNGST